MRTTTSQLFIFAITAAVLAVVDSPAIFWIIWAAAAAVALILWFVRR